MDKPDPRLGFTSASNALPDILCPGRHLAQRGLPGYTNRDADAGQLIHSAFAGDIDPSTLIPAHRKTVVRGREIEEHMVEQWYKIVNDPLDADHIPELIAKRAKREIRLWAYKNGQKIHSGAIDAMWFANDMGDILIEDLKSLFGEVDDAPDNLQLRDYAALAALNYGAKRVIVFINQPNVRWGYNDQEFVTYQADDLAQAIEQMERRVMASNDVRSERLPNFNACKYCLACATDRCPESLKYIKKFAENYGDTWETWGPASRGTFIKEAKLASKLAEAALEVAWEKIKEDPNWALGWQVTKDSTVRKIKDGKVGEIAEILGEKALMELQEICHVRVGDLEGLHAKFTEATTAAERATEFKILFEHLMEQATRRGSLKPKK